MSWFLKKLSRISQSQGMMFLISFFMKYGFRTISPLPSPSSSSTSNSLGSLLYAMLTFFTLQRSPHTLPSSTSPLSLMWRVKVELCDMPGHVITNWTIDLLLAGTWYMVGDLLCLVDTVNCISWPGFSAIRNTAEGIQEMSSVILSTILMTSSTFSMYLPPITTMEHLLGELRPRLPTLRLASR